MRGEDDTSSQPHESSSGSADRSLDEIADDLIGETEIEMTGDDESMIAEAKRRAKGQQRDPAIDLVGLDSRIGLVEWNTGPLLLGIGQRVVVFGELGDGFCRNDWTGFG